MRIHIKLDGFQIPFVQCVEVFKGTKTTDKKRMANFFVVFFFGELFFLIVCFWQLCGPFVWSNGKIERFVKGFSTSLC